MRHTRNGVKEDNKLRAEDRPAHDWYRFILSFPPHLVRTYLERFGLDHRRRVLDPFCGTGTTLVECKKNGVPSVGTEPNPMAWFASHVKVNWQPDPDELLNHARAIARITEERLEAEGVDDADELPLFRTSRKVAALKTLPAAACQLLLKDSISPLPLHKTLVLLETMASRADERFAGSGEVKWRLALPPPFAKIKGIGGARLTSSRDPKMAIRCILGKGHGANGSALQSSPRRQAQYEGASREPPRAKVMASKHPNAAKRPVYRLSCKACGNSNRFLQVMEYESHIVNGKLDYVRLVDAVVKEYRCCGCGRQVKPRNVKAPA